MEGDPCLRAKQSDLVITGAAATSFRRPYGIIESSVWVLQSARIVALDRQRQRTILVELRCTRQASRGDSSVRLVSASRLPFPRLGSFTRAIRVVYDHIQDGQATRQIGDYIDVFEGNNEFGLHFTAAYVSRSVVEPIEVKLATQVDLRATKAPPAPTPRLGRWALYFAVPRSLERLFGQERAELPRLGRARRRGAARPSR